MKQYKTFWTFYPYYLTEHANATNRGLHFAGTTLVMLLMFWGLYTLNWKLLVLMPLAGYGFAWVGHFFVEKNRPATFTYPLYSLGSDFVMWWHMLTGRIDEKLEEARRTIATKD